MSTPEFSPQAVDDLRSILEYIAKDRPRIAMSFVAQAQRNVRVSWPVLRPSVRFARNCFPTFAHFPRAAM